MFAGWMLVIGGAILTPLPIPLGLLSLSLGLALLAHDSRRIRHLVRRLRRRFPTFSERLARLEQHAPHWLARVIRHTEPRNTSRL